MSRNADTRKDVARWLDGAIQTWEEDRKQAIGQDQAKTRRSLGIAIRICRAVLMPGKTRRLHWPDIDKADAENIIESIRQFAEVCGLIDDAPTIEAFVMIFAGQMSARMDR